MLHGKRWEREEEPKPREWRGFRQAEQSRVGQLGWRGNPARGFGIFPSGWAAGISTLRGGGVSVLGWSVQGIPGCDSWDPLLYPKDPLLYPADPSLYSHRSLAVSQRSLAVSHRSLTVFLQIPHCIPRIPCFILWILHSIPTDPSLCPTDPSLYSHRSLPVSRASLSPQALALPRVSSLPLTPGFSH